MDDTTYLTDKLWDRYLMPAVIASNLSDDRCDQGWHELANVIDSEGPWAALKWAKEQARILWP